MEIKRKNEIILTLTFKETKELKETLGRGSESTKLFELLRDFLNNNQT